VVTTDPGTLQLLADQLDDIKEALGDLISAEKDIRVRFRLMDTANSLSDAVTCLRLTKIAQDLNAGLTATPKDETQTERT
jgi:hypothetical protein